MLTPINFISKGAKYHLDISKIYLEHTYIVQIETSRTSYHHLTYQEHNYQRWSNTSKISINWADYKYLSVRKVLSPVHLTYIIAEAPHTHITMF